MKRKHKILITLLAVAVTVSLTTVPAFALTESEVQDQVNAVGKEVVTGNLFVWFLCAIAFLKVSQKIDSFMPCDGIYVGLERAFEAETPRMHENFDKGIHGYVLRLLRGADITLDKKYQSVAIGVHELVKRALVALDKTAVATLTVVHWINPFEAASRLSLILSQKSADFLTCFGKNFKKARRFTKSLRALLFS